MRWLLAFFIGAGCSAPPDAAPVVQAPGPTAVAPSPASSTSASVVAAGEHDAADLAVVRAVLGKDDRADMSIGPFLDRARKLEARFGERAMALLATFLPDDDLGWTASETMLALDRKAAAPLVFDSMPKSDRNVQHHTFRLFIRVHREGGAIPVPQKMHDAAVRCLEADTNADAAVEALLAIGLTGSNADVPLLSKQRANQHPTPVWRARLRHAAEAALARLGHAPTLRTMDRDLHKKVTRALGFDDNEALCDLMDRAAFSGNPRFTAPLCTHLDDPAPTPNGDMLPRHPAFEAARALQEIVHGKRETKGRGDVPTWKAWCRQSTKP